MVHVLEPYKNCLYHRMIAAWADLPCSDIAELGKSVWMVSINAFCSTNVGRGIGSLTACSFCKDDSIACLG